MTISIKECAKEFNVSPKLLYNVLYKRMVSLELNFMKGSSDYDSVCIPTSIYDQIKSRLDELLGGLEDIEDIRNKRTGIMPDTKKPVVYFLFQDEYLVYVGMTYNIRSRFNSHKQTKEFNCFTIITSTHYDVMLLEACYINRFNPPLNNCIYNLDTVIRMILERIDLSEW